MKKHTLLFALIIIASLSIIISSLSCEKTCEIKNLADLLLKGYSENFDSEFANTKFYNISNVVLNAIDAFKDCSVETAEQNTFNKTITYSETPDFSNAKIVDVKDDIINALPPTKEATIEDKIGFLVDGYYQISSIIDFNNDVKERNEDNNDNEHDFVPALIQSNPENIIHIEGTHKRPQRDANGKEIYLKRVSSKITYH